MPRPSLKAERTEQIFDAFFRCVARYGVDGASLEKVAEEAKLQRSMIRHFVGNRDALINGLAERLAIRFQSETASMVQMLPKQSPAETLVQWLFDPDYATDPDIIFAFEALIAAAPRFPKVKKHLLDWYSDISDHYTHVVQIQYPDADYQDCQDVAFGIIGIYFNTDSMGPIANGTVYRSAGRRAALRLLKTLAQHNEKHG